MRTWESDSLYLQPTLSVDLYKKHSINDCSTDHRIMKRMRISQVAASEVQRNLTDQELPHIHAGHAGPISEHPELMRMGSSSGAGRLKESGSRGSRGGGERGTKGGASPKDAHILVLPGGDAEPVIPRLAMDDNGSSGGRGPAGTLETGDHLHRREGPLAPHAVPEPASNASMNFQRVVQQQQLEQQQRQYRALASDRPSQAVNWAMPADSLGLMSGNLLTMQPGHVTGLLQPLSVADLIEWR